MNNQLTAVNEAQVSILTQTTPPHVIKTRKGRGGQVLSYVSHDWVTRQLNEAFRWQWSFEILDEKLYPETDPAEVVVKGRLTVHTPTGDIVKVQFGGSDVKRFKNGGCISLADDLKAAGSDCLKKCASLLGLALDLYGDSEPQQPTNGTNGNGHDPATTFGSINELVYALHSATGASQEVCKAALKEAGYSTFAQSRSAEMFAAGLDKIRTF